MNGGGSADQMRGSGTQMLRTRPWSGLSFPHPKHELPTIAPHAVQEQKPVLF